MFYGGVFKKMKKINSTRYGGRIIGCGLIFLVAVPFILYFLQTQFKIIFLSYLIGISIVIGIIIECFVAVILIVEFHQDKKIGQYCNAHKNIKVKLKDGRYECLNCGNLAVKKEDSECSLCGVKFKKGEIKTVGEILKIK